MVLPEGSKCEMEKFTTLSCTIQNHRNAYLYERDLKQDSLLIDQANNLRLEYKVANASFVAQSFSLHKCLTLQEMLQF